VAALQEAEAARRVPAERLAREAPVGLPDRQAGGPRAAPQRDPLLRRAADVAGPRLASAAVRRSSPIRARAAVRKRPGAVAPRRCPRVPIAADAARPRFLEEIEARAVLRRCRQDRIAAGAAPTLAVGGAGLILVEADEVQTLVVAGAARMTGAAAAAQMMAAADVDRTMGEEVAARITAAAAEATEASANDRPLSQGWERAWARE
jgi:hypothetical protein